MLKTVIAINFVIALFDQIYAVSYMSFRNYHRQVQELCLGITSKMYYSMLECCF